MILLATALAGQDSVRVVVWQGEPRRSALAREVGAIGCAAPRPADPRLVDRLRAQAAAAQAGLQAAVAPLGARVDACLHLLPAAIVTVSTARLADLAAVAGIARIEAERPARACLDQATDGSHHNADHVHAVLGQRGANAVVAIVDTGVDLLHLPTSLPHPAFLDANGHSRVVRAWSAFGSDLPNLTDRNGHGTGVAAIAAARRWNALPQVDDGFAPEAGIASYRVTQGTSDVATTATLAQAYDQILLDRLGGLPIAVVNCSFKGSPDPLAVDQVALDRLALLGDVVVVVSGGNSEPGDPEPLPTIQSQSACNGLAVGAIAKQSLALCAFSASGPLPGDGERTYPDLVAVGQDVHTARRVDSAAFDTVSGTSFSAPMVAGTAALVRSARPDLDALTTRALLLQNTGDIGAANPGRGRQQLGAGMLRTDLAVQAAIATQTAPPPPGGNADFLFRGTLPAGAAQTFPLSWSAGARLAIAAAWWRTDLTTAAWPDLDLTVRDPAGRVIGLAAARRNLWERLVVLAPVSGVYTVEVRSVAGGTADLALLAGPDLAVGRASGHAATFAPGCAGSGPRIAGHLVLPAAGGAFGTGRTNKPLADQPCTAMVAWDRAGVGATRTVRALAFRRAAGEAASAAFAVSLRVTLGYTQRPPDSLLAAAPLTVNFDPTWPPVVASVGTVAFPATSGVAAPDAFDFVVPLSVPWVLDPARGHPLLMFEVLGNSAGNAALPVRFDAVDLAPGATGRLVQYAGNPTVLTANVRLVMAFVSDAPVGAAPRQAWSGEPIAGAAWELVLRDAAPHAVGLLLQGASSGSWGGVALPLSLAPLGAPGCALAVAGEAVLALAVDAAGQVVVPFAIPASTALVAATVFHQFAVFDAPANAAGAVLSDASFAIVGG